MFINQAWKAQFEDTTGQFDNSKADDSAIGIKKWPIQLLGTEAMLSI